MFKKFKNTNKINKTENIEENQNKERILQDQKF